MTVHRTDDRRRTTDHSKKPLSMVYGLWSNFGFSLLELVISMAILSIALLGLIQMFPVGLRASKHAGDHTMMTFLGQQKMSDIEQSKLGTGDTTTDNEFFTDYPSFSWICTVTQDLTLTNLYHASILIYCNDRGDTRIEEFVTLYVK